MVRAPIVNDKREMAFEETYPGVQGVLLIVMAECSANVRYFGVSALREHPELQQALSRGNWTDRADTQYSLSDIDESR